MFWWTVLITSKAALTEWKQAVNCFYLQTSLSIDYVWKSGSLGTSWTSQKGRTFIWCFLCGRHCFLFFSFFLSIFFFPALRLFIHIILSAPQWEWSPCHCYFSGKETLGQGVTCLRPSGQWVAGQAKNLGVQWWPLVITMTHTVFHHSVCRWSFQILLTSVCKVLKNNYNRIPFPGIMLIIMCQQFTSVIRRLGSEWFSCLRRGTNITPCGNHIPKYQELK